MIFFLGIMLCIAGFTFTNFGEGFLGILMMAGGAWLIWYEVKKRIKAGNEWSNLSAGAKYSHSQEQSGIAIDIEKRIVYLRHPNLMKSYPFSEIRSWRYKLQTGGHVNTYGNVGLAGASQVVGHNLRTSRENKEASGFFVTVKDIDNPEWRAAMSSEKEMKKWMEIFEQYVNEN